MHHPSWQRSVSNLSILSYILHASRSGLSHFAISDVLLREHTTHATRTPLYWESKARTVYNWCYTNQYNNQLLNFRVLIILNETLNSIEALKKLIKLTPYLFVLNVESKAKVLLWEHLTIIWSIYSIWMPIMNGKSSPSGRW